ncbi:MAG: glycosyltransferase [Clostridia bacterium]|nr:glycosyltransferase [Clostridia bacterium]
MKIIEMTDAYLPTVDGVIKVVNNYANEISKTDECLIGAPKAKKKDKYIDNGKVKVIRCLSMGAPENYRNALPQLDAKFLKTIKDEKPDLIHAHTPFLMGRASLHLAKKLHIPLVATLHTQYHKDFDRTLKNNKLLKRFMLKFISKVYKKADSVWTVSNASKKYLEMYGYKGKVEVIRNATDFTYPSNDKELIEKINSLHNLSNQENVFIFVGRMAKYKNLYLICDALSLLKEKTDNFKMIFVGGGFDLNDVKKYAKQKGIFDECIFTGDVKDSSLIQGYYLRSDLLIFPSTFDMASIAQIEASAHKKAAVVTKDSCSSEQITDGENGFICEENAQSYSEKLYQLMGDKKLMFNAGINAYNTLYRTWEDVGVEVKNKYKEIIENYKRKNDKGKENVK